MMVKTVTFYAAILVAAVGVDAALDCSSPLRILHPWRFTHCSSCLYGSWSGWNRIGNSFSNINCNSRLAYEVQRTRKDNNGSPNCKDKTQAMYRCEPTASQQASIVRSVLGLKRQSNTPYRNISIAYKRNTCSHSRICHSGQSFGKRALIEDPLVDEEINITKLEDDIYPEEFNLDKHLSHAEVHRRKRQTGQNFMLFILDASGSIGTTNFNRMKNVVAGLVEYRCDQKFAIMSYSNYVYGQYCFNCHQPTDRFAINSLVQSIPYSKGVTASGDAVKCACDYALSSRCGLYDSPVVNVTVIFITDGHSNTGKDVCEAAKCWDTVANRVGSLYVFPIGVGHSVDWKEVNCIKGNYGTEIKVKTFKDLEIVINMAKAQADKGTLC